MRNTDAKATCQSDGKADNQKMNGACISNCGKRRISDSFSDNHGIHEAVKLLEQISDQNGQEKLKNQFHAVPSCHIICCVLHGIFLSCPFSFKFPVSLLIPPRLVKTAKCGYNRA